MIVLNVNVFVCVDMYQLVDDSSFLCAALCDFTQVHMF